MRKIVMIAWKDIRLSFVSPMEWLFFLILPIVFTVILAGGAGPSADNRIRLVVAGPAGSSLSQELIAALDHSQTVRPDVQPLATAEQIFSQRQVAALLVIPAGFDEAALQQGNISLDLRQQPNNMNALIAAQAVQTAAAQVASRVDIARSSVAAAEKIRPFENATARTAYFEAAFKAADEGLSSAPNRLAITQGNTPSPVDYDPRANSSAGQLLTWVWIPLLGISGMFAYERQKGTLRRLLTTPTTRGAYLLGAIGGQVLRALVQMLLLVGFGVWAMGLNWGHAPLALAVMLVSSALAAAALGAMLGTFVKTEPQANGLSIMLGMVMALLSGCWYPIELFPQIVRTAVKILPLTWAMQGMLDLVLRGQGLAGILPEAAVLLGFAAVFFTVGIWRFRYE